MRAQGTGTVRRSMSLRLALAVLLLAAAPAAAQDDRALLERHAPVLHYDARDRDRATSVAALAPDLRGEDTPLRATAPGMPDVAHGRVVRRARRPHVAAVLAAGLGQPQRPRAVRSDRPPQRATGRSVQIAHGPGRRARKATYCPALVGRGVPSRGRDVFVRPRVARVASRSRGTFGAVPDHDDEARATGRVVRPRVEPDRQAGRGGPAGGAQTRAPGWSPARPPSPRGPAFQDRGPVSRPAGFPPPGPGACGSGSAPHPWPVVLAKWLAAGGILLCAAVAVRRIMGRTA
jgi:hypothetical protein